MKNMQPIRPFLSKTPFSLTLLGIVCFGYLLIALHCEMAWACSCAEIPALDKAIDDSTVVFLGQVIQTSNNPLRPGQREVKFSLKKLYKDDTGMLTRNEAILYTAEDSSLCGYTFVHNQDYLVFATGNAAKLSTSLCSRTQIFEAAQADVDELTKRVSASASSSTAPR